MKQCSTCLIEHSFDFFNKKKSSKDGLSYLCKNCTRAYSKKYKQEHVEENKKYSRKHYKENSASIKLRTTAYLKTNVVIRLLINAKRRAKERNLEFNIVKEDLLPLPTHCPVLGIELVANGTKHNKQNSYSLDRVDNTKGYIKGNVIVVSFRANTLKNSASKEELRKLYEFYGKD